MHIDDFFPYRLAVAAEMFSRRLAEVYDARHGLSREEWRLLFLLNDAKHLDSLQVAQRTSLDKVQVSRAAGKLEAKGLLVREIHAADRRLRRYSITPEGQARFAAAFGGVQACAASILDALAPDDREALLKGVGALHTATRANGCPAGPEG